ncbi:PstS family phosphate ABC transporter substrate-binding protein [Desulfitobacterium metallireducens]|uniref:PBP domain-containing protein n=1 Tax=Desulfitobacterium metallireducens DSM 15288 TaxID=871968 RepID=W0EH85_9FIRM|nr:substrate-binding domain-containing protein [Desulfitobacterium metallireducens]AHF08431.1 hypothetical protein DESME_02610 [Desulfitobacterium metallireducens DSM 15288]
MLKKLRRLFLLSGLVLTLILLLTACGTKNTPEPVDEKTHTNFTVAGSGSNLPITQRLIEGYMKKSGQTITLPKSIGSGGAIKALRNNAIDLGLLSRPLKPEEVDQGLKQIPYARVAVVIGVHPSVLEEQITGDDLAAIFKGTKSQWRNGQNVILFSREEGDSTNEVLKKEIPGFKEALTESLEAKRWQVSFTDEEEAQAITQTKNSIGFTDSAALAVEKHEIKPLLFDGIQPTIENVEKGTYKLSKDIYFAYKEPLSKEAQTFLEYVWSNEGQEIIRSAHGIPLGK